MRSDDLEEIGWFSVVVRLLLSDPSNTQLEEYSMRLVQACSHDEAKRIAIEKASEDWQVLGVVGCEYLDEAIVSGMEVWSRLSSLEQDKTADGTPPRWAMDAFYTDWTVELDEVGKSHANT